MSEKRYKEQNTRLWDEVRVKGNQINALKDLIKIFAPTTSLYAHQIPIVNELCERAGIDLEALLKEN